MYIFYKIVTILSSYSGFFSLMAFVFGIIILILLGEVLFNWFRDARAARITALSKETVKTLTEETLGDYDQAQCLRYICAADGIDPNMNNTLVINDGGRDVFVRTFTIVNLPKRVRFASTFSELLNFENCTSSIFVEPIPDSQISGLMDRHIITLESEYIGAAKRGDTNRKRKIRGQYQETEAWAENSESGEASFYYVGFLFTIYAETFEQLNSISDEFHAKALAHRIDVASCFATQGEAFMSNGPFNKKFSLNVGPIKTDSMQTFIFDHKSLSTVFNYTQAEFSHRDGVFLGRNMDTQKPICFDIYDKSHLGFTMLLCGKTGSGKSATIKILSSRYLPFGYNFVGIDSQARGTVGEYAGLAELYNGVNFQIKSGANMVMNIFEVSESNVLMTEGGAGREIRTLELDQKIVEAANTLMTMVQDGSKNLDNALIATYVKSIVLDNVKAVYADKGIRNGDPDSLMEEGNVVVNGAITTGRRKKALPTLTDFYYRILLGQARNSEAELEQAYSVILYALRDFVKDLIYSVNTLTVFTPEQYAEMPQDEKGTRLFVNEMGMEERVLRIKGVRAYFDGQSTIAISRDCRFTNIDISQLPESERVIARQIAFDFVNESYIKKNSQNMSLANKLVVILDEAHENFAYEFARVTIDNIVRTARKRNVSIWLSTQTLVEYDRYDETRAILSNAAVKFLFRQDFQHKDYLMRTINLTESQADRILSLGGNRSDDINDNDERAKAEAARHRGEVCIVDGERIAFCKVDYLKQVEMYAVETDAEEVRKMMLARGNNGVA